MGTVAARVIQQAESAGVAANRIERGGGHDCRRNDGDGEQPNDRLNSFGQERNASKQTLHQQEKPDIITVNHDFDTRLHQVHYGPKAALVHGQRESQSRDRLDQTIDRSKLLARSRPPLVQPRLWGELIGIFLGPVRDGKPSDAANARVGLPDICGSWICLP